ncbi:MAG: hypothetical protein ACHQ1H_07500 [Nitrososphaerales archaeon]
MSDKQNGLLRCRNCGHPVLTPVLSDFCANCGQLTGIRKADAVDPKHGEILFELPSILGKSYKFFSDKFVIYKGSRVLEEIPYSTLKDCDVQLYSRGNVVVSEGAGGGPSYLMTITLTLDENPERQIEFTGNPMNAKLDSDLAFWLNAKVAENESK